MSIDQPRIDIIALPLEERDLGWSAGIGIESLDLYVNSFMQALSLFRFSRGQKLVPLANQAMSREARSEAAIFSGWASVAARDGAMSVYHFMRAMEGVKACVHRAPSLKAAFNPGISREATKLFGSSFPSCEEMRHAIAHEAELSQSPEKYAENSFTGSFNEGSITLSNVSKCMISNLLDDDVFRTTINGNIISYSINKESYDKLQAVKSLFYSAFGESKYVTRIFS